MTSVWETIIALVLSLTSFSVKPNPKAPAGDAVLAHAVDDADLIAHLDWRPTVAANYPVFTHLPDDPLIQQVPELRDQLADVVAKAEAARALARSTAGFDPIDHLDSMTIYVGVQPGGVDPRVLVDVRGTFPAGMLGKLSASAGGDAQPIDGRDAVRMPDGTMLAIARDGSLLVGAEAWVRPRAADGWKPSARTKGSAMAQLATALDARPFLLIATRPSSALLAMANGQPQSFGRDLATGHELAIFTASATGIGWVYQARTDAFARRVKVASEGVIDLMRAAQIAPRGFFALATAALPSYQGLDHDLDTLIAAKDKLATAASELIGDGTFTAKVKLDGRTVTVTAIGKKLSDVVPLSMILGFGAIGWATVVKEVEAQGPVARVPATTVRPAPTPVPPGKTRAGTPTRP